VHSPWARRENASDCFLKEKEREGGRCLLIQKKKGGWFPPIKKKSFRTLKARRKRHLDRTGNENHETQHVRGPNNRGR